MMQRSILVCVRSDHLQSEVSSSATPLHLNPPRSPAPPSAMSSSATTALSLLLLLPRSPPRPAALRLLRPPPGRRTAPPAARSGRWTAHALYEPGSPVLQLQEGRLKQADAATAAVEVDELLELYGQRGTWQMVREVREMLRSMTDGVINASAYDTAWVAMVKDRDGGGRPQFPSCIRWIVDNQLPDGSWGDAAIFSAHDRMINTIACVVALRTWKLYPDVCARGVTFVCENMYRLGEAEAEAEHMPIGFEVAFPSLMDIAESLGLEIPYAHPALQDIYDKRELKLQKIPKQVLHQVPTTLLYSLEGMQGLEWKKLLHLQCADGSFLFSPSSTAYALMQTADGKCVDYLQKIVRRFEGGVPNVYPVDLFEHLWAVDRLERLGIARYFEQEIKDCLDYVHRYWTEDGICWARNSRVQDIDDTAMGFRLLRLHGYDVSSGVFRQFEKDGGFVCFAGQSNQAVTGIYNLNRASQVAFAGEKILERARSFSYRFLREKQAGNDLLDKWIITKDLPGEVEYALDFPWYASLPRVEARMYIEQYGGENDVWIGKTLYRMPLVNNDVYLELAKADFNQCQALHQFDWLHLQKWYEEVGLRRLGVTEGGLLKDYYLAATCIFEPDRAAERLGWARTATLARAISTYLSGHSSDDVTKLKAFLLDSIGNSNSGDDAAPAHAVESDRVMGGKRAAGERLAALLLQLLDRLASDARPAHHQQIVRHHLREAWKEWLGTWRRSEDGCAGEEDTGLLLVRTVELCAGRFNLVDDACDRPARLLSSICRHLRRRQKLGSQLQDVSMSADIEERGEEEEAAVEEEMQELAEWALKAASDETRKTFLMVAKSFYYAAHCAAPSLSAHICNVLFRPLQMI